MELTQRSCDVVRTGFQRKIINHVNHFQFLFKIEVEQLNIRDLSVNSYFRNRNRSLSSEVVPYEQNRLILYPLWQTYLFSIRLVFRSKKMHWFSLWSLCTESQEETNVIRNQWCIWECYVWHENEKLMRYFVILTKTAPYVRFLDRERERERIYHQVNVGSNVMNWFVKQKW